MMLSGNYLKLAAIPVMLVLLSFSNAFAQTSELRVEVDAESYSTGDTITATGSVGGNVTGQPLVIQVFNSDGDAYRFDQVMVAADGSYTYKFKVGGPLGVGGTYRVVANYNSESAETTFDFAAVGDSSEVTIAGESYKVRHHRGGVPGWVGNVTANTENTSLAFELRNTEDVIFQVELDSVLIDTDSSCFTVLIDGSQAGASCEALDDDTVLLTVPVPAFSQSLEIVGTSIAPEFGTVAIAVLAAVVALTIAATRRSSLFGARA
jgi:predicted secreted protein with PEFG-CTERM motif